MKRRKFIINSALAVGGTALLAGCGKKEVITKDGQISKRKFHDLCKRTHGLIIFGHFRQV